MSEFNKIEELLDSVDEFLEDKILPAFKKEVSDFYALYSSYYSTLIKNRVILEDQYRSQSQVTEISVLDESNFQESQLQAQMGIRMSNLDLQLDYLTSYCSFNFEFINSSTLKIINSLIRYIHWEDVYTTSNHYMSRNLANSLDKFLGESAVVNKQMFLDQHRLLTISAKNVLDYSNFILIYIRQQYRRKLRNELFPNLSIPPSIDKDDVDSVMVNISKSFYKYLPDEKFYSNIIKDEFLSEFCGEESLSSEKDSDYIEKFLTRIYEEQGITPKNDKNSKNLKNLKKSLNSIEISTDKLFECYNLIVFNISLLKDENKSFFLAIVEFFKKLFSKNDNKNSKLESKNFTLEYYDNASGTFVVKTFESNEFLKKIRQEGEEFKAFCDLNTDILTEIKIEELFSEIDVIRKALVIRANQLRSLNDFFAEKVPNSKLLEVKDMKKIVIDIDTELEKIDKYVESYKALDY